VSVSTRKTKPNKQSKAAQASKAVEAALPQIRVDVDGKQELVDPDEERYCVCGDISYGELICCELDEKVSDSLIEKIQGSDQKYSVRLGSGSIWNVLTSSSSLLGL
jgi:hypothetical protein